MALYAASINNPIASGWGMLFSKGIGLGVHTPYNAPRGGVWTPSPRIKYKFGSGRATGSTTITTNQLKGKSESAVLEYLRQKHHATKNLEIIIEKIDWK
jgi:hypothetical protein